METLEIKQEMFVLLDSHIENLDIKKEIYKFIEYKEKQGFGFSKLTIKHFEMFNGSSSQIIKAASSIEFLNLALDIVDDIQDEDNENSPWSKIDKATLINHCILLIFLSQQVLVSMNLTKIDVIMEHFNKLTMDAIQGQYLDLNTACKNEKEYLELIQKKSGALTSLAAAIGVLMAKEVDNIASVIEYSSYIGISEQLLNDASDLTSLDEKSDIRCRKITFPVIYLLNHPSDELNIIKSYYREEMNFNELMNKKEALKHEILTSKALEYTLIYKEIYVQKALKVISKMSFPNLVKKTEFIKSLKDGGVS
ncbi:polyprenyl synthetase family protein [Bacillus manliponensis]|uniref:polyprenyl synthetase family protein n=1 Tax=Bacillus manliponensis TaxID=574376 RepID=UPI003518081D